MGTMPQIKGFIDTSFLDWDGKVVSVLFLPGCNFRCPFCHNSALFLTPDDLETIPFSRVSTFLASHRDFVDGVCITGGEPTLRANIEALCREITSMGFDVKLDTNGTHPETLRRLIESGDIAAVAMDVKAPLDARYEVATGTTVDLAAIRASIDLIIRSSINSEFRTTVVPTIHTEAAVIEMAKMLAAAKKYVLQQFNPENSYSEALRSVAPYPDETIRALAREANRYVPTQTRGIS